MILRFGRDRFDCVWIITPSVKASLGVLKVTKSQTFLDVGSKPLFDIMFEIDRLSSYYFAWDKWIMKQTLDIKKTHLSMFLE